MATKLYRAWLRQVEEVLDMCRRGLTVAEIRDNTGLSWQTVANVAQLERLDPSLWELLRRKELPRACAYELARVDQAEQRDLWRRVAAAPNKLDMLKMLRLEAETVTPDCSQSDRKETCK